MIAALSTAYIGCRNSEKPAKTNFPAQNFLAARDENSDLLKLVVEVGAGGKLSLNKIEIGTIADASPLCEKLKAIFDDRRRTGVASREVYVYPRRRTTRNDLENLIEKLAQNDASPIFLIGDD